MTDYQALKDENEDLVIQDELENRAVPRGLPVWVGLHTTTACNLKCVFCLQADGLTPRTVMDDDVFVTAAMQLFPTARVAQLTASGEPFLTPQLNKALDIMEEFGVKLEVITNGTLLNDRAVVRQAAELADTFSFSLDGATAATFNALRIGADFHQVMENIRAWNRLRIARPKAERPRMTFAFILMRETIRELEAMVDIAHACRADLLTVNHLAEQREEVKGWSLEHSRALSNHYLQRAREKCARLGLPLEGPEDWPLTEEEREEATRVEWPAPVEADAGLLRDIRSDFSPDADPGGADVRRWDDPIPHFEDGSKRCHFLWRRSFVAPKGEILTCCHPDAEFLGNIREKPFREIWTGKRYAEYRERVYSAKPLPICDDCFIIGRTGRTLEV